MKLNSYIKGDRVIWVVVFLLTIISILVVYSSSNALAQKSKGGNTEYFLIKHSLICMMGFVIMYLVHKFNYKIFSRLSQIGLIISIPLLLFTLLKGISAGEASRWLEIPGIGLTFQTSDFAKLALIVYVARILTVKQDQLNDFKTILKSIVLPVSVICALIFPANFSTAALIFFTCLLIMFVGRVPLKFIGAIVGACLLVAIIGGTVIYVKPDIMRRGATWKARIENFVNGDSQSNYQSEQAKIAVARGYGFGVGPGNSTQRNFLPQAASDFIFAIIIEEYGTLMGLLLLFLYMILFFRAIRILRKAEKTFGGLLAIGLSFSLVFQAMINMAVAVNLFPVTGQPLPLVSMGGTSIWFTSIAIGIILSVSREVYDTKGEEEPEEGGELAAA
ncbi:MAG TPA: FtsW/RodA/SpoVE family cell cycle protein [Bacteroidia bacterium]|jgi:cell division protein FtsW|nr:FtsW/RodA/SpoVE family cell cycle protein [Bacteroidia bacterium]